MHQTTSWSDVGKCSGASGSELKSGMEPFLLTWLLILCGPLSAWALALANGAVTNHLHLLVVLTSLAIVPLVLAARSSPLSGMWLGIGVIAWLFAGYYYAIGLWT